MQKTLNSTKELIADQLKLFQQLGDADRIVKTSLLDSLAMIKNRIQQRGQKSDGSQIGKYSEATLNFKGITGRFGGIANKKQSKARLKEFGDTDEFYGGYKEFRESLGRQTEFVDLTLSGETIGAFTVIPISSDSFGLGFNNAEAAKIAEAQEKKYGEVYSLTDDEEAFINEQIEKRIDEIFG
jgi:hypothetical protein